jgi:hypothetical protein
MRDFCDSILKVFGVFMISILVSACAAKQAQAPRFDTPEHTFDTWKRSVIDLDLQTLIRTYIQASQLQMRRQIENESPESLKAMSDETKRTSFRIEKIIFEDKTAFVRVNRRMGQTSDIEVLTMILESDGWKLVP